MKQIVVVSGKGGSGKTFVSSSLAAIVTKAVFADCDVDAANLHLMLHPQQPQCEDFVSGNAAVVDPAQCTSCGACESACRFDAIHLPQPDAAAVVDPVACEGCAVCELVCPAVAITMVAQRRGHWCRARTALGPLVYAHLDPGEENSGKLVDKVRRVAAADAEQSGAEWVLIDGPPGTGCAARSAITGTDYVVIVTEPTVTGIHDMLRVFELAEHFRIPIGMVINKATISPDQTRALRSLAEDREVPVLGEIPFSRTIPEALTELVPYPRRHDDEITAGLRGIWSRLQDEL